MAPAADVISGTADICEELVMLQTRKPKRTFPIPMVLRMDQLSSKYTGSDELNTAAYDGTGARHTEKWRRRFKSKYNMGILSNVLVMLGTRAVRLDSMFRPTSPTVPKQSCNQRSNDVRLMRKLEYG
ncbi:hypothetical protein FOXB_14370 [Fusarium oxysporum f. sp. conglutinans Fo5176]|uniref:Uncharacterized protein n=1 Tax=Fusarium oxysporum (strain Fo5176) TaxID=660025 RepID=F9G6T8_FUSOF|nr:hypothetical protein FOXB_14370 [Fusarium oxysporum f. sp. conglutinans Fo5176]